MTLQAGFWFHSHRGRASVTAALAGALLMAAIPAASGAELVPLSGFWSAMCLRTDACSLIRCDGGEVTLTRPLRGGFACAADGPDGGIIAFDGDHQAIHLNTRAEERVLQRLPWVVRRCVRLADGRYLLLVGGHWRAGLLWQTQAVIWEAQTGMIERAPFVRPEWNAFDLTPAPPTAVGNQRVMVSVRKQAPFDRAWRVRPFLFEYRLPERRFLPLWKGTSFSRPHFAVSFADWQLALAGVEIAALEDAGAGGRAVSAYEFDGGVRMTRTSGAQKLGSRLGSVATAQGLLPVAFARDGEGGRLVAFGGGNKMMPGGVSSLEPTLQTELLPAAPLAWTALGPEGEPVALILTGKGRLRLLPLKLVP